MYYLNNVNAINSDESLLNIIKQALSLDENNSHQNDFGYNIYLKNGVGGSFIIEYNYFDELVYKYVIIVNEFTTKYIMQLLNKSLATANNKVIKKQCFAVNITDLYGGELNYSYLTKIKVRSNTVLGVIRKVSKETGLKFRIYSEYGDEAIYHSVSKNTGVVIEPLSIYNMIDKEPI